MSIFGKAARGGLWALFPPAGLWASAHHGIKQHEKRQAKLIGEELRRQPTELDLELERIKKEMGK